MRQEYSQSRIALTYLTEIKQTKAYKKPLFLCDSNFETLPSNTDKSYINIIVNTWMDIEFGHALLNSPIHYTAINLEDFFESQGHSLKVMYQTFISILSLHYDPSLSFFSNAQSWDNSFEKLTTLKINNYYFGSPLIIPSPSIGMFEIMECQAKLHELRLLNNLCEGKITYELARNKGGFRHFYYEAFKKYIEILDVPYPDKLDSPLVNMFLLVCDLAMNPGVGYPFDITHCDKFIEDVHPGFRFINIIKIIKKNKKLIDACETCDSGSYHYITNNICEKIRWYTPKRIFEKLSSAIDVLKLSNLEKQYYENIYDYDNLFLNFLFIRHLKFFQDRLEQPEFFCWPTKMEYYVDETLRKMMGKHQGPFTYNKHENTLYYFSPEDTIFNKNRSRDINGIYVGNLAISDIIRQLISKEGPFYNQYSWAINKRNISKEEFKDMMDFAFASIYDMTGWNLRNISSY